jgi:DNA-binding beta-propeller fold protein YncE
MISPCRTSYLLLTGACLLLAASASAQNATTTPVTPASGPYKVINTDKVGGPGNWDYVYADSAGRRLYIPRGNRVDVYDLDANLKPLGNISNTTGVHGAAVDPASGHGFCSSNPVVMWDAKTLATIKTIPVQGSPDGIFFEPATERVYILSHRAPNVTVIDAKDGSIVGTIDLGGSPEEGASDGQGHAYIDLEDKDAVAVVDTKTLKLTGTYDISSKGGGPGGLALDAKNRVIFAFCHDPQTAVILNADTGNIITALPIGNGVDAAEFNPNTLEAFSSQGDATLTVIKESSPTSFAVEQTVTTKSGARTSTIDTKTGQVYLVTADRGPATPPPAPPATPAASAAAPASNTTASATPASNTTVAAATPAAAPAAPGNRGGRRGGRGQMVPNSFTIIVVGK